MIEVHLQVDLPSVYACALSQMLRQVLRTDLHELARTFNLDPVDARAWHEAAAEVRQALTGSTVSVIDTH